MEMSPAPPRRSLPDDVLQPLLASRDMFLAHVRRKLPSTDAAEDVLQESYLRALRAAPDLRADDRLIPWFFRILNNAVIDLYRHRASRPPGQPLTSTLEDILPAPPQEDLGVLCECFRAILPSLKPEYAQLLERMDLQDTEPDTVARDLGISRNNLKVRHHRARQALRRRLEESCRLCARHGCLDCTCQSGNGSSHH